MLRPAGIRPDTGLHSCRYRGRKGKAEKLRGFGKYYTMDPDTDLTATQVKTKNEYAVYVAGLSYDWSKEFMPFIAWEREDNKRHSARIDYDKYQIGFQLNF